MKSETFMRISHPGLLPIEGFADSPNDGVVMKGGCRRDVAHVGAGVRAGRGPPPEPSSPGRARYFFFDLAFFVPELAFLVAGVAFFVLLVDFAMPWLLLL
jgi:hypothetical protein